MCRAVRIRGCIVSLVREYVRVGIDRAPHMARKNHTCDVMMCTWMSARMYENAHTHTHKGTHMHTYVCVSVIYRRLVYYRLVPLCEWTPPPHRRDHSPERIWDRIAFFFVARTQVGLINNNIIIWCKIWIKLKRVFI